ncbi:MAG: hypothetical protein HZB39_13770 [Planctomycetes bacterium]|nr:hypothetical protein [Planctomycetota bacterium]
MLGHDHSTTANARLLECFASFLRSRTIYPANNQRVMGLAAELIELVEKGLPVDESVAIRFAQEHVLVGVEQLRLKSAPAAWLAEMLRRTSLAGVELRAPVTIAVLEDFARELHACAHPVPTPLVPRWADRSPALRPLPFVVEGHHAGSDEDPRSLRAKLAKDPQVRDRLARLGLTIQRMGTDGGGKASLDVLQFVVNAVEAEVEEDPEGVVDLVCDLLDGIQAQITQVVPVRGAIDESVREAAERVARRYFTSDRSDGPKLDQHELPAGRPEDAAVDDSLTTLVEELRSVEWSRTLRAFEARAAETSHIVAVLVELIASPLRDVTPARAARRIVGIAARPEGIDFAAVEECLGSSRPGGPVFDRAQAIAAFVESGNVDFVFGRNAAGLDAIAAVFPQWFDRWLATLQPSSEADRDAMARVVAAIGTERFVPGLVTLAETEELRDERQVARLGFLLGDHAAAALGALIEGGNAAARPVVVQFVPRWSDFAVEATAVRLLPAEDLPDAHFVALCRLVAGDRSSATLVRDECGALLRAFVRAHASNPAMGERRLRVIQALARFPSAHTTLLLQELARSGKEGKAVRRVATDLLAQGQGTA